VLIGHVNVIQDLQDLIVHFPNVQEDVQTMVIAQMVFAIADKDGEVILVKLQCAQIIVIIMENVLMENVIAVLVLLEMIVQLEHAHQIVTITENVLTTHANATMDSQDSIVLSNHAVLNVPEMDIATTEHASANLASLEFLAHSQLAHHHALEMEDVSQLVLKWPVNVTHNTKVMIVQRKHAQVIVQDMVNALMEFALVKMVGEEVIVPQDAQDMDKDVVVMENVLKANVIATLDGLVMDVILEHVFMIVHNTDIAATVLVSAKKDTEEEIVHYPQNHNHANVQFIAFVVVFNNAPKSMKHKVQDHHMNVTVNVPKNVFHFALLEKCLKI